MKTKYISSLLILFLLIIFSCKKELQPQESSDGTIPPANASTSISPSTSSGQSTNSTPNASLPQNSPVGMNPPHGQAGHRCDIAVGAPLNSPPNKSNSTTTSAGSNSSSPAIIKTNSSAVVTQPGMNPPHGQPGHRCDIAVGAPLNSPSSKNVSVPAVSNSNANSEVPALLKLDSTATSPK